MRLLNETIDAEGWAPPDWAAQVGMGCRRFGGATVLTLRSLPHPMFNRAIGLGVVGSAPLNSVVEHLRAEGASRWALSIAPGAGLETELTSLGLVPGARLAVLTRSLEDIQPAPCPFRLSEVSRENAAEFARVLGEGYGTPPFLAPWNEAMVGRPGWTFYLARDGAEAVACAGLFVHGDVAMLAMAATLPSHRGRGAQSALMERRLRDAHGCRMVVAQTDDDAANPSLRNMLRAGFTVAYSRTSWTP